GDDVLSACCD
nr:RecName: Full=Bowman-Birk type proteinase inhibitor 1a; AltName: Full=LSI-1a [Lathyrus sativus]